MRKFMFKIFVFSLKLLRTRVHSGNTPIFIIYTEGRIHLHIFVENSLWKLLRPKSGILKWQHLKEKFECLLSQSSCPRQGMFCAASVGRALGHMPGVILEPMTLFTFSCVVAVVLKDNFQLIPFIGTRTSEMTHVISILLIHSLSIYCWLCMCSVVANVGCPALLCLPGCGERRICKWLRGLWGAQPPPAP